MYYSDCSKIQGRDAAPIKTGVAINVFNKLVSELNQIWNI